MSKMIGITCSWNEGKQTQYLSEFYIRAVVGTGGTPLLIPTVEPDLAKIYYGKCDGFIFSGGGDVDPNFFGEEPCWELGEITPKRDAFELALARLVLEGEKPVLAICRGIQLLNIAAGGTLYQDIKNLTKQQHYTNTPRWHRTHHVDLDENSKLFKILQQGSFLVNSFHHQSLNSLGTNLKAVGWSRDGIIEAVETVNAEQSIYGVQWHPEGTWNRDEVSYKLFAQLIGNEGPGIKTRDLAMEK